MLRFVRRTPLFSARREPQTVTLLRFGVGRSVRSLTVAALIGVAAGSIGAATVREGCSPHDFKLDRGEGAERDTPCGLLLGARIGGSVRSLTVAALIGVAAGSIGAATVRERCPLHDFKWDCGERAPRGTPCGLLLCVRIGGGL